MIFTTTNYLFAMSVILFMIFGCSKYQSDINAAYEHIQDGSSQVIETSNGPIEYAITGSGQPVLVLHGIFGGYDQGLVVSNDYIGENFYTVAPSRFGYLRTPLPDDATPASQADAYEYLLDSLGISKVAIIGTSAGGTSAIQFALRHPDRCSMMVLISSIAPGKVETAPPPRILAKLMFKSDFIFWLLTTKFRSKMSSIMGVPKGFELTPEFDIEIAEVMKTVLPVKPRSSGALFDMYVSNPDINANYPFEKITIPVLIISAIDDPMSLFKYAQSMSEKIPGSKLLVVKNGGHMLLGHKENVRKEIITFLNKYSPTNL